MCDDMGMDTISAGGTLAFAMELTEKGLLESDLAFGRTDNLAQALEETFVPVDHAIVGIVDDFEAPDAPDAGDRVLASSPP